MPRKKTSARHSPASRRSTLSADVKRASAVRRVPHLPTVECAAVAGIEGAVAAFELDPEGPPIVVEAVSGRALIIAPGDTFLGTPGFRESTRWVVGSIPSGGLVPGDQYWVLAESGVVGNLLGDSPLEKGHLGRVTYLGTIRGADGHSLNIRNFALTPQADGADYGAPVFLVLGTSAEVGKTTAGLAVLRALQQRQHAQVVVLKATGTAGLGEITTYRDFGAASAFDAVDFGLPTTYPSGRRDIAPVFEQALETCLALAADAVVIECGGDLLGANVPEFLACLQRRRRAAKVVLAAADALGALGAKQVLQDMGLAVDIITGPCTDTPTLRQRTQDLCGVAAVNMARGGSHGEHL